jgi:hypothetical protein
MPARVVSLLPHLSLRDREQPRFSSAILFYFSKFSHVPSGFRVHLAGLTGTRMNTRFALISGSLPRSPESLKSLFLHEIYFYK